MKEKEPATMSISKCFSILQSEVVAPRFFSKYVLLKILQNSQENTCVRDSFLIKLQALKTIVSDFYYWFQNSCYAEQFPFMVTLLSYLSD